MMTSFTELVKQIHSTLERSDAVQNTLHLSFTQTRIEHPSFP